jgi:signal transduction histidine kinase
VPFGIFFGTMFGSDLESYFKAYQLALVFAYCIGLGLWAWRYFLLPRLDVPGRGRTDLRVGISVMLTALLSSYVAAVIIHFTLMPGFLGSPRNVAIAGMWTLLFAALFTGINFAIAYYRQSMERARQVEQIRAELAEAELRALRAQINPHFLFNTLNSIAALITEDPAAAEETTTRLADVFRYALQASEREHARLGDELAFLRSYLEIERTRFGSRLRVEEAIEPGLDSVLVPSLLLQPVVENAVRHAVSARPEGAWVRIAARRDQDKLTLEVADDGPGMNGSETTSGTGFGLHAVRERLRASGLPDALVIDSARGQGTRVRISLPLRLEIPSPPSTPGESRENC